jgi:hypothetical protein
VVNFIAELFIKLFTAWLIRKAEKLQRKLDKVQSKIEKRLGVPETDENKGDW